jgi:hypothetical protein
VDRKHQLMVVMAVLILSLGASTVLAEEQPKGPPPPPPAQSLANDGFLYVLVGQSIHQYQLPDMTFQKTVTLPGARDFKTVDAGSQRPPMPPILSFLIDGEYLYIVGARYMYQYSLPDLDLQVTQSLPKLPDSQ